MLLLWDYRRLSEEIDLKKTSFWLTDFRLFAIFSTKSLAYSMLVLIAFNPPWNLPSNEFFISEETLEFDFWLFLGDLLCAFSIRYFVNSPRGSSYSVVLLEVPLLKKHCQ